MNGTLVLTAADVGRSLSMRECIDAVSRTLPAHEHEKSHGPSSGGMTLLAGSPGNPERRHLPTIQGALPLAIMDSTVLTAIRTAAVAAVAADHLARKDARIIAIIGCGDQGE